MLDIGLNCHTYLQWLCGVVAGVLHYLLLCVFCWMLAEGIMLYILFVKVLDAKRTKFWHFIPLGWGMFMRINQFNLLAL